MVTKGKEKTLETLTENLKDITGLVFTEYQGLNVEQITQLRKILKPTNTKYHIVKNTYLSLVLKKLGLENLVKNLTGPTAIAVINSNDPLPSAKKLLEFSKEHEKLKIKYGYILGEMLSLDQLKKIANLPSKEILLAQTVGVLKLLLFRLVNVLRLPQIKLVCVLEQIKSRKS